MEQSNDKVYNYIVENKNILMDLLNRLAFEEFKHNYNISEFRRAINYNKFDDTEICKSLKNNIEKILDKVIDNQLYIYSLGHSGVLIVSRASKKDSFMSNGKPVTVYQNLNGGAVSKQTMKKYVDFIEQKYNY